MFGLKLVKEADYYKTLQKKQEVENLNHSLNIGIEADRNAVKNLKNTNRGLINQLIEAKNKNYLLRSDVDGLESKLINSQNDLEELSKEYSKLKEKYDFEHVENKMKIKGFDRGQYYQVLGFTDKANAFVRLRHSNLKSLRGKIFNFDQLKKEILSSGLEVGYFDIVRVDVKI